MTIRGLLVFYVDVGHMPHSAESDYIKQIKEVYTNPDHEMYVKLPEDISVVFVPQDSESTYIDYIPFDVVSPEVATQLRHLKNQIVCRINDLECPFDDDDDYEPLNDYSDNSYLSRLKRLFFGI